MCPKREHSRGHHKTELATLVIPYGSLLSPVKAAVSLCSIVGDTVTTYVGGQCRYGRRIGVYVVRIPPSDGKRRYVVN